MIVSNRIRKGIKIYWKNGVAIFAALWMFTACVPADVSNETTMESRTNFDSALAEKTEVISLESIPSYNGSPYVEINGNDPFFDESEKTVDAFEHYSTLDSLGRCGVAYANICNEIMPTEKRGSIGSVKPSGWQMSKYDFVDGKYLYNRCHLIGFQLAGENANPQNLITGTRYLNVEGMLPFENQVADYVRYTGNHVLYRVTPIFHENELVARGVLIEARSVETDSIRFCVYCYNVQPGVTINYADGSNQADGSVAAGASDANAGAQDAVATQTANSENVAPQQEGSAENTVSYVLNTNTNKFHYDNCRAVKDILPGNRADVSSTRSALMAQGYAPCGICKP